MVYLLQFHIEEFVFRVKRIKRAIRGVDADIPNVSWRKQNKDLDENRFDRVGARVKEGRFLILVKLTKGTDPTP